MVAETMKSNSTANLEMKSNETSCSRRLSFAAFAVALAALHSSCGTAKPGAWAKIQSDGLIPYLVESQSASMEKPELVEADSSSLVSNSTLLLQEPRFGSELVTAQAVAGKPGFVYSPHTAELLQVDVRDYRPGEQVRCPYTKRSFVVPGARMFLEVPRHETQIASAPVEETNPPEGDAKPLIVAPQKDDAFTANDHPANDPVLEPKRIQIATGPEKIPSGLDLIAPPTKAPGDDVPVGRWVPGKPNYVYSPFAASNQVVDVEGHAPGTKVKCPYTGKVFAVPARN